MTDSPATSRRFPRPRIRRWNTLPRTPALLLLPFFGVLTTLGLFPLIFSFVIAFYDWNPLKRLGSARYDGLWTYQNIFTDTVYAQALFNSLVPALLSAVWQHLVALPLAFGITLVFRRIQGVLGTVLFLPYIVPPLATAPFLAVLFTILWRPLGDLYSALQTAAATLFPALERVLPFTLDSTVPQQGFNLAWNSLGWNVLLYLMAMNAIPRQVYEAAQVDGASLWQQFRRITLPLVRPMIFVAFTLSFVAATQVGVFIGGNGKPFGFSDTPFGYVTIPNYIDRSMFGDFDGGLAAGQTWVFFGAIAIVVGLNYLLIGRRFTELDTTGDSDPLETPARLAPAPAAALKLLIGLAVLTAVLPALAFLLRGTQAYGGPLLSYGIDFQSNYASLLQQAPNFWRSLWNTTYIATLAALGATLTSLLAGYAFAMLDFPFKRRLYAVVLSVMLFPALSSLIPTVFFMELIGWINRPRALWLPALASGIGVFLTRQFLQSTLPRSVMEAARIDGASTPQILRRIVLPAAWPVLITVFLLTFVALWKSNDLVRSLLPDTDVQIVAQAIKFVEGSAYDTGAALALLPTLLVFLLAARQMARGLNITSGEKPVASTPTPAPSDGILPGADAVRAVACLMVIAHHLSQRLNGNEQTGTVREWQAFFMTGSAGVSAFFVLSGLLLSLPFWRRYLAGRERPSLREYVRRRFLRIAPGFWASLSVSVLLTLALVPDTGWAYLRWLGAATFTSGLHYVTFFPADLNGPLWSIGFEVICYVLMPIGMLALFRFPRRSPALAFGWWLALLGLTLLAHNWIIHNMIPGHEERGWQYGIIGGAKYWMPNYNPIGFFAQYALGVLAAGVIAWRATRGNLKRRRHDVLGVLLIGGLIAFLWGVRHVPEFGLSLGNQPYYYPFFPLLIAGILVTLPFTTRVGRLVDRPFLRYTARISFGLYIWHYLILELIRILHNPDFVYFGMFQIRSWAWTSAAALLLAYWAAHLSYKYIEQPFLSGMQRTAQKARPELGEVEKTSVRPA